MIRGLLALSASPSGFTASQLADHVVGQTALSGYSYGPRQASYDLQKLRAKGLWFGLGKTRRYEASPEALRMLSAVALLQNKVIRPVLASLTGEVTTNEAIIGLRWTSATRPYVKRCSRSFRNWGSPHESTTNLSCYAGTA